MSLLQPTIQPPIDVLREVLASGVTGRLALGPPRPVQIYCMHGAVMAAHAPDDGTAVVRRLVNHGALTARQGEAFVRSVEQGRSPEDLLLGHVPDRLFHEVVQARFEENLLPLFQADASCQFSAMDALFVRNIQIGHDTGVLLTTLARRAAYIAPLAARFETLTLRPGPSMPASRQEARLRDLCDPSCTLASLLAHSPTEPGRTLEIVQSLLTSGTLVSEKGLAAPPAPASPRPTRPQRLVSDDFAVEDLFRLDEEPQAPHAEGPSRPPAPAPPASAPAPQPDPASDNRVEESQSLQGGEAVSLQPVEARQTSRPPPPHAETLGKPEADSEEESPTEDLPPRRPTDRSQHAGPTPGIPPTAPATTPTPVSGAEPGEPAGSEGPLSDEEAALFAGTLKPAPAAAAFFA